MGNVQSAEDEAVGYRVLGVQPNSPASDVGLVSFFDFIVAANGLPLRALDNSFIETIKGSVDKPLPLTVYNYKSQTERDVTITPSRTWGGQGMLGVTIRFDSYHNADDNLVRVLEVAPGSPSQIAGLEPGKDYLLGTAERVFKNPDILFEEVVSHLDQPMEFYVYNTETDKVRVAVVLPTNQWGGHGALGAEVGHGYLHRLPQSCRGSTASSVVSGITVTAALDATGGSVTPWEQNIDEIKGDSIPLETGTSRGTGAGTGVAEDATGAGVTEPLEKLGTGRVREGLGLGQGQGAKGGAVAPGGEGKAKEKPGIIDVNLSAVRD